MKFHKKTVIYIIFSFLILLKPGQIFPDDGPFEQWKKYARSSEKFFLMQWIKCKLLEEVTGNKCKLQFAKKTPLFFGRCGIFITLKKDKTVRGCFGAFSHKSDNIEIVLAEYIKGAAKCDPRYNPVDVSEIDDICIIVTITDIVFPVRDINLLDISKYGIIVTDYNNNSIIYVPAEIRSIDYLKQKLQKTFYNKQNIQYSAFRALSIK